MDWDHSALAVVTEEHLNLYSSPKGLCKAELFVVRMKNQEGIELSEILNKHQALISFECLFNLFLEFWTLRWVAVGPFYSLCFCPGFPTLHTQVVLRARPGLVAV